VISGINTDIEFGGVVYHVQTEDKGMSTRKIISLVYDGGTILASKRTTYDDLVEAGFDETVLAERVQKQHKLICAAIRAGRINELKEMTAKASAAARAASHEAAPAAEPSVVTSTFPVARVETQRVISIIPHDQPPAYVPSVEIEMPNIPITIVTEEYAADEFIELPMLEDVQIVDDPDIMPAEAVEVVSELSGIERPSNTKLGIELLGDLRFKGGDRVTVNVMICRGTDRKVVPDAQIMVKVLGSSFRPVIFHARSDNNGLAQIHLQLPHFNAGRAAMLLRAIDGGEEIELRRIVTPG
jgi:hypothetical protein